MKLEFYMWKTKKTEWFNTTHVAVRANVYWACFTNMGKDMDQ